MNPNAQQIAFRIDRARKILSIEIPNPWFAKIIELEKQRECGEETIVLLAIDQFYALYKREEYRENRK